MDFLDPRKKRAHHIRLMFGYVLLSIAIGLGTIILVYGAYGYSLNTKTGDVVENGLLFVDSKPGGADFYLNNQKQSGSTSARLVLQSGEYNLKISKSGYLDWQRKFILEEHQVARYVYPFLFPAKPVVTSLKNYSQTPAFMSESPDRHWLVVQSQQQDNSQVVFDEFDTTALNNPPVNLNMPVSLLTQPSAASVYSPIEWSTDNNYLLIKHIYGAQYEFILLDRRNPDKSTNLNRLFKTNPTSIAMRDKKINQLYIYEQANQTLRVGTLDTAQLDKPLLKNVLAFKPYASDLLVYVTADKAPAGKVQARIWENAKSYPLYTFTQGSQYLIDVAKFQGHYYYVAGSNASDRINLYKDPLDELKNPAVGRAHPLVTLRETAASFVSFSANARFITVQAGQNVATYDLEESQYYRYSVAQPLTGQLKWMDGHRLIGNSSGSVLVLDYDNTNAKTVTASIWPDGGLFDQNYNHMFTLAQTAAGGQTSLNNVDLRAGKDLPASSQQ